MYTILVAFESSWKLDSEDTTDVQCGGATLLLTHVLWQLQVSPVELAPNPTSVPQINQSP